MSVKLRKRKLPSGEISLYLDIYFPDKKRKTETLHFRLGNNKAHNKELLQTAEGIRAKKELELFNNQHGMIPQFKKKINFVEYFHKLGSAFRQLTLPAWIRPKIPPKHLNRRQGGQRSGLGAHYPRAQA